MPMIKRLSIFYFFTNLGKVRMVLLYQLPCVNAHHKLIFASTGLDFPMFKYLISMIKQISLKKLLIS